MNLTRDEFRAFAAGTYVQQNKGQAIKTEDVDRYVEGAIMAWDKLTKKLSQVEKSAQQTFPIGNGGEFGGVIGDGRL